VKNFSPVCGGISKSGTQNSLSVAGETVGMQSIFTGVKMLEQ
jgi:hypothetical protein